MSTRAPAHRSFVGVGLLLLLVGSVLPWLRGPTTLWGWDVSVLWPLTGDLAVLHVPPSVAAVSCGVGVAITVPLLRGRPLPGPVVAVGGGLLAALGALTLLRALTFPEPLAPRAGFALTATGALLVVVGALVEGDEP